MRVLIRRPHAYWFLNKTFAGQGGLASATPTGGVSADGTSMPIPGLYLLDPDGGFLDATSIQSVDEVLELLKGVQALGAESTQRLNDMDHERVSLRVSGFTAAEGIT